MSEPDRIIVIGCSYDFPFTFTLDGVAYPMTAKTGLLRLRSEGDPGTVDIERDTDTAAQCTWTSQAGGTGTWHWKSNESLTPGTYLAEVYTYDTSTPVERRLTNESDGPTRYRIIEPRTGDL